MAFTPYYSGGWQSGEEGGTPITPDALNHYDDYLETTYTQTETDAAIAQSTADEAKSYDVTGTTWADVYSTLSKLAAGRPAVVSIAGGAASLMTGSKTAFACTGIAKVVTSGVYEFMVMSNISQYIYTWRITGLTSASSTPTISTVYRFSGTAV
jgi:hypothetical protein